MWAAAIQTVRNDTTSVVSALKPVGRLEASRHLRLAISLPLRNQAALIELLRQLQDPSSPNYHKYLTPAQFTERFGPAETDYEAVAAFAKAHGLTVTARHPNRMILDVDGAVSDIEKTLHVTMRTYQHPREPRQFYAPDADPTIAGLPVSILHVSGLDDYSIPHPNLHLKPAGLAGKATPSSGSGPGGTYAGGDFRAAYVPGTSMSGSGQSVALLEFDAYYASDISSYQAQYGPPTLPPLANVPVDGGVSTPGGGDAEVSLDIEMAMSMAPKLSAIYVYEEPNGDPWVDILNQIADDDFAKQVSCSWAGGSGDPAAEPIFIQMAMQGQSFFQASGDSDAYTGPIPFPSDSSNITVVGATELSTTGPLGSFVSETVWNWGYDAGAGEYVGSSGGVSTTYTIPSWQQPVSMSANQGSTTMRDIPDVAMVGDNIEVYYGAGLQGNFGGTSCAAPLWAAFTALVNQQAVGNLRNTVGFINPAVYAIGTGAGYTSDFNDTSTGNNFSSSSPTKFSAVAGYDLCTGWGSPAGTPLINALAGPLAPIISTGSPLPNGVVGTAYSTALAASGGLAPYTWSISAGNLPAGLTLSPNGGVISGTPGASGASSFTVQVTGSNGAASTTPFNLTIYPQGTPIIATASPLASGTVGVAYSQTFVATGGATPYTWSIVSGSPPPGLIFSSVGLLSGTPTATGSSAFTVAVTGNGGLSSTTPFYMTVNPPEPVITSALSVTGTVGVPLSYHITASNSPTSYGASGLPAGLSVNSATGVISGTASATGISNVTINATNAGGTGSATLAIVIVPDQVSYFTISSISSSQVLNAPIAVTITAYDINNIVITAYAGTLSLTATNSTGAVPISPTSVSGFVNGVWTGTVAVQAIATNVVLTASDGAGHSGSSDAFNVAPGPLNHFGWSAISSPQQALEPFAVTITAQDAGNNTVASYSGSASLTCSSAGIPIGVTPAVTGAFSAGVWSGNVTLLQTGTAALLRATDGIANFYVADSFNDTIREVTAAGVVTTVAGSPLVAGTTDGTGSGALFRQPYGVALDGTGAIYVADSANNTIRKITTGGVVTTLAGSPGLTGTNDGTGSAARFNDPYGLAVDGNGNVYIADTLSYTIRKMTPGGVVTTIGGRPGVSGTQAGVGSTAGFSYCVGIVVSPAGTVYVVDSGNDRISQGVPVAGQYAWSNFAGMPGAEGSVDGTGSGALFDDPEGIALDGSGNQYVTSNTGDTVRRVSPAGVVTTLAGVDKSAGSSNGTGTGARFYAPYGVGMDLSGNAWVVDSANSTIREVTPAGVVTTVAGTPLDYGTANGTGGAALFHFPNGGASDNGGDAGDSNPFSVTSVAAMSVSPATGLSASGTAGGPFTPATTTYTISNFGTASMNWTVSGTSTWLSYSPAGGTLPSGSSVPLSVTINSAANSLGAGSYGDTMTFTNTTNGFGNTTFPAILTVVPPAPVITSSLSVTGTSGLAFTYQIAATGSPASFGASGLPSGLSVNTATGLISGTATVTGTFDATITAANAGGVGSATLAITISPLPPPVITSALSVTGTVGVPLSYHITASNSPASYLATGLPSGLAVNTSTGLISGTVSATGTSTVTISATNAGGTGSATLAIVIVPDQVSYFTVSSISSPQVLNAPIAVSITAYDINNIVITAYAGTLSLTATDSAGAVPISPTGVSGFVNGVWMGTVTVQAIATNVVLTASDGAGHSGSSNAFNVAVGPLDHFAWSTISSPQQALEPFAVTITAQDAGNNTVASYSGSASLTCSSAGIPIGVTPAVTGAFSAGVWSGNVTLLQTGTAALLRATDGIANFYVADSFNSTIRKVTAAGVVTTVAGTPLVAGTTDGTGSGALFGQPYGVAVDGAGVIYVADSANNTIRKITAGGVVTTLAGSPGLTGTNDGTGSAARFNDPYGLAVDGNGNLYIADTLNYTVRKMTPGGAVTTIGGRAGVSGTQAGVGSAASFSYCVGIVVSPAGTVYVVDSGNDRISEGVSVGGQYTWSNFVGMPGSSGSVDGTGSGALFDDPEGIALDGSGNQYVTSSTGDTVRRVSPAGVVMTLAGVDKSAGSSNGTGTGARFYAPYGVGMDLSGNAWVVDSGNSTIREVTPAGAVTTVAGSPGNYGYANGTGSAAQFHFPNGGATDNGGHAGYSNSFNISQPASISVSPAGGLSASGTAGGPFTPESTIYTISNTGNAPVNWTVSGTSGWLSYSTTGGTIASGFSVPLSVTVNSVANTLASGNYGDTITFANTTNGVGNTTRPAALTVFPSIPVITSTLNVTGTSGVALSYSITATNSPATYNATGLPAGLSVNMMTGLISGTVAASGTFDAVISASNLVGTGSATLAITMRTTFSAWQDLWFTPGQLANPAISGDMATPAGDGIPNLLKYALNLNPLADGAGGLPVGSLIAIGGTDYLTLTYRQVILATDITYIPEVSGDLQTWNSGLGYVATVSVTPNADGVTETVVVQDMTPATPGTSQYIRLRVTAP